MRFPLFIVLGLLSSVIGLRSSLAQLPEYSPPIPLTSANNERAAVNANHILFYKNGAVLGAPGVIPQPQSAAAYVRNMLADPAGLCHENWLVRLTCPRSVLEGEDFNALSFNQVMADVLGDASEGGIIFSDAGESIGSIRANLSDIDEDSPHAICYDIAAADDWLACPVFGIVYLRLPPPESPSRLQIENPILKKMLDRELLRLESPIILYRRGKTDPKYHLAGYLSNPSLFDYLLFDNNTNPAPHKRFGGQHLPLAIAAGNFSDQTLSKNQADIAIMGTATLPHFFCQMFRNAMQTRHPVGRQPYDLPHKNNCTAGLTWVRVLPDFSGPPQVVFDSLHLLIGGPAIYDMAAGKDKNKTVLFAPSGAKADNGKVYVYKYYEEGMEPITHNLVPVVGELVPPRPIEVRQPANLGNAVPFKIAVQDINEDGLADFALTWKLAKDTEENTAHHLWASSYSPFVSVFIAKVDDPATGHISYNSYVYPIPQWNAASSDNTAQISSVAFGKYNGQKFLAVGNQKRINTPEGSHAFVSLFPIVGGVIDNLNVQVVRATLLNQKGPGIADVSADENGNLAALSGAPFIRAPEGCNRGEGEVFGSLWTMSFSGTPGGYGLLDVDGDGVPNRCECPSLGMPNPPDNDEDWDEFIDDPSCDSCPGKFNIGDFEKEDAGRVTGDKVDDACDNCPPSRCENSDTSFYSCICPQNQNTSVNCEDTRPPQCLNRSQSDADRDGIGDSCDSCPDLANEKQTPRVYFYSQDGGKTRKFCHDCPVGYVNRQCQQVLMFDYDDNFEKICGGSNFGSDWDNDGMQDIRDNCIFKSNSDQRDSDQDGSGDACDCVEGQTFDLDGNRVRAVVDSYDDCDNDTVPNRFDRNPFNPRIRSDIWIQPTQYYAHLDTVYDPQAGVIADADDLINAGTEFHLVPSGSNGSIWEMLERLFRWMQGEEETPDSSGTPRFTIPSGQPQLLPLQQSPERLCGMSSFDYPGPVKPCHYRGDTLRELNVLVPKSKETGPGPGTGPQPGPDTGPEPGPIPGPGPGEPGPLGSGSSPCIAKVGHGGPKTVAIFENDQKIIQVWNSKVRDITGIADYDLFVGGEGGIIHYECLFYGGAAPKASKATGVLPNVSGNVAPFGIWQTKGMPPLTYAARPSIDQVISQGEAFRLAPQESSAVAEGQGEGKSAMSVGEEKGGLPTPDIGAILPDIDEETFPESGVQAGKLAYNINGSVLAKVMTSENAEGSGADLAPSDVQSLVVLDVKSYPEPFMAGKPIEERQYNVAALLDELRRRVAEKKEKGEPITIDIYRDLPWEAAMKPEFVMAQNTIPEVVSGAKNNQVILPSYIAPPGLSLTGSGCGCRFYAEPDWPMTLVNFAVLVLTFFSGVLLRTQWAKRATKRNSSTGSGTV